MSTLTSEAKSTTYCRRCATYHSGAWRSFCPDCGLLLIPADSAPKPAPPPAPWRHQEIPAVWNVGGADLDFTDEVQP
jgi:hypothetical protein